jgi:mannose-6-phosphate isomerase-like protein (cupin superfamily)
MHLHRNEAEHFCDYRGSYRIAIGEKIFEVSAGASITLPKGVPIAGAISPGSPGARH